MTLIKAKDCEEALKKREEIQSQCKHKKRIAISLEGFNLLYCVDCDKEWYNEDI